jgi:hypothetical protein
LINTLKKLAVVPSLRQSGIIDPVLFVPFHKFGHLPDIGGRSLQARGQVATISRYRAGNSQPIEYQGAEPVLLCDPKPDRILNIDIAIFGMLENVLGNRRIEMMHYLL